MLDIESTLASMTLEEKVAMAAGADMWHSTGVERLDIAPFKMTDGPNGARGGQMAGGPTSACFPVGISLAATWNTDLVYQVGVALAQEAQTKSAHILLAPTVNIHRSPLSGRNFECYSEDPYLSARMAVAYIEGVQSQGVGACVKHFVCNDSEYQRHTISSEVRERPLREIYLPPFKAAVQEADVWAVMSAYNKLNGTYCCDNAELLNGILKEEWDFDGYVVSDWMGTQSTVEAANAGLDLEMPGPAKYMGDTLLKAVRDGLVSEQAIDDTVCRLLRTINRSGVLEHPEEPERSIDRPEHRQLIRQAATEGIVLLKNEDQALPLDPEQLRSIAVIGPNAKSAPIMGGGSARVNPHYVITSWQGIIDRCPDDIEIGYEQGCTNYRDTPLLDPAWLAPAEGEGPGLTIEYYDSLDLTGEPVLGQVTSQMRWFWWGDFAEAVDAQRFSVRLSGTLIPPESGTYAFSLSSRGLSRLFIDGEQVVDNWTDYQPAQRSFGKSGNEVFGELELEAGQSYRLVIEYSRQGASPVGAMRVGCLPAMPGDLMERAVQLAARADVALLFIGTNDEWESEGFDRPDMDLPGRQAELLEKVVAANPNTIVILNTGSPIIMPWLDTVPAVLQAWFPGQECGNAIASILFGDADPSGRLPQTFPVRLQDNPAYINYPGENDRVVYGEGLFVGYRYYDRKEIEPLFPFGYGLSYTTFDIDHLQLSASKYKLGQQIELSVEVTNTGSRAGKQVVQLYVRDVECSLTRPDKELKRFSKVSLDPGEQQEVQFVLTQEDLAFYDDLAHEWVAEAGTFEILVGVSSRDIAAVASFQLVESTDEQPEPTTQASGGEAGLSKQSVLRDILAHPQGEAVLREHFGDMIDAPQLNMAMGLSLEQIAGYVPNIVTDEKLDAVDRALQKL